jgi:hypothetical protein
LPVPISPVHGCKLPPAQTPQITQPGTRNLEYLLMDFGESGNNFIEIGKEPKGLKSML